MIVLVPRPRIAERSIELVLIRHELRRQPQTPALDPQFARRHRLNRHRRSAWHQSASVQAADKSRRSSAQAVVRRYVRWSIELVQQQPADVVKHAGLAPVEQPRLHGRDDLLITDILSAALEPAFGPAQNDRGNAIMTVTILRVRSVSRPLGLEALKIGSGGP